MRRPGCWGRCCRWCPCRHGQRSRRHLRTFAQRRRITRQMLVMFLQSKYPDLRVAPQALDRLIQAERSRRVWEHQIASLATMPYAKLACLSRKIDRIQADSVQGRTHAQHGWACALSPYVATEMERRAAINERADPRRVRRQHAEYLTLVEHDRFQRRDQPASRAKTPTLPQAGPSGRVCSPNNVSIQHELFWERQRATSHRCRFGRTAAAAQAMPTGRGLGVIVRILYRKTLGRSCGEQSSVGSQKTPTAAQ